MEENRHIDDTILTNRKEEVLNELNIAGYKYKYKDKYKNGYCYRCINRASCKLTITISFEEYAKILNKKDTNFKINFTVNSKQQQHSCITKKRR